MKPNYEDIIYPIEMIDENQSAVILNGSDLVKVKNLKRKYSKIINNPSIKIIRIDSKDKIDEVYDKLKAFVKPSIEEINEDKYIPKYYWNVPGTKIWCPTDLSIDDFKKSTLYRNDYKLSTKEEYIKSLYLI